MPPRKPRQATEPTVVLEDALLERPDQDTATAVEDFPDGDL